VKNPRVDQGKFRRSAEFDLQPDGLWQSVGVSALSQVAPQKAQRQSPAAERRRQRQSRVNVVLRARQTK
jgi:hypothetical protein